MQSRFAFIIMSLLIGAILPIQAIINARLSKLVNGPIVAAFISFAVGTIALFLYLLVSRQFHLTEISIRQSPWWIWTGGLLGTFFVAGIVILVPRLGVALAFSLVIAGQMVAALIFDHFGLMGVSIREISWGRIAGAILLVAGVLLIRKT